MRPVPGSDPIDYARALLVLARLMYRSRRLAAAHGILDAYGPLRELVQLGQRLAMAVEEAETAEVGTEGRKKALEVVTSLGDELWCLVDDHSEGIRSLVASALSGIRGSGEAETLATNPRPAP